jgi:hypothetical protein
VDRELTCLPVDVVKRHTHDFASSQTESSQHEQNRPVSLRDRASMLAGSPQDVLNLL